MMTQEKYAALVEDKDFRASEFTRVNELAQDLYLSVKSALSIPDDITIPGWKIKRIFFHALNVAAEMRLCESTEANVPYTVESTETQDCTIIVQMGTLRVTFDDGTFDLEATPGKQFFLPAGLKRTTIAAEHPTALFALFCGRPEHRERHDATTLFGAA